MIDKLNKHRKETCLRQKVAWEETIDKRLSECEEDINSIPIVIWGLEASPSYFDVNNNEKKIGCNNLHENYLYNEVNENGNNYGVMLIKKWINKDFSGEYKYTNKIEVLSKANFNLSPLSPGDVEIIIDSDAIHLVYDIFPEWHGLKVSPDLRNACFNEHYMCEKIPDFKKHLEHIDDIFSNQNLSEKRGEIYFVWLGTKQANKKYPGKKACATFFCCLKKEFENIKLYYNPKGFVTKSELEAWQYDCPADFLAFGVPTDWSEHIVQAGYHTVKALRKELPATVCEKLNGFREEKNLEISILKPEQVESWFSTP